MPKNPLILIGAGGHAKVVLDALASHGKTITHYVDTNTPDWLSAKAMSEEELQALLPQSPECIMGFVGLSVDALSRRLAMLRAYQAQGARFPVITHTSAIISPHAKIAAGAQVMAASVINAYATIAEGVVINTAATVEHDTTIRAGSHIAPRAVVLGGASIGECCFIGSNAVVIQEANVPSQTFVKAQSVHNMSIRK